eukprot:6189628-Pleurochrysis_carterae.AAC.1
MRTHKDEHRQTTTHRDTTALSALNPFRVLARSGPPQNTTLKDAQITQNCMDYGIQGVSLLFAGRGSRTKHASVRTRGHVRRAAHKVFDDLTSVDELELRRDHGGHAPYNPRSSLSNLPIHPQSIPTDLSSISTDLP